MMGRMSDAVTAARALAARTFAAVVALMPLAQARREGWLPGCKQGPPAATAAAAAAAAGYCCCVPRLALLAHPANYVRVWVWATVFVGLLSLQGAADPPGLDDAQREMLGGEGRLLLQLLDNRAMDDYHLPIQ